ncbi:MAG TPA: D-alanyl-D-alanine carboxypeptidase/D-alanyl-D-alanine-endopeptidase, partial [Vicinamibacterales bacterium]|nr:D-alanyl-D-alanine carboxypeptidase/D-alanyl-D-alanine-endopeptidase [Vicinamibacterales bacterium]
NMKILTLAAAAETLGWDYRFTTTLETASPVEQGVLRGDLFIRGTGDPTINWRDARAAGVVAEWARALKDAGIHRIEGRIVGDDQAFDEEWLGGGWSWDYLQYGYAAPVGALQFNESTAPLSVLPGAAAGEPAAVSLPPGTGLTVLNRAVTVPQGTSETLDFKRHVDRAVLEVTGLVPLGSPGISRNVAVVNPTLYFVESVRQSFIDLGIPVEGGAADIDDVAPLWGGSDSSGVTSYGDRKVLASTTSPPLREIGIVLMKFSQNLYAETLVKAIGAARGGLGSIPGGRVRMQDTLTDWNIPRDAYIIADGSGLSRYNYVSAEAITAILERMYRDPRHREAFAATLPIAGRDGTIGSRMRRSRAEGNAMAKTGSIANVRSLSGYVETRDGETLVFSILANDFPIPASTVTWIADLAVEVLANFTRR